MGKITVPTSLRAEVEAEMQAEQRDAQKMEIKRLLRLKITMENTGKVSTEQLKKELATIDEQIADVESGKTVLAVAAGYSGSTAQAEAIPGYSQYHGMPITVGGLYKAYVREHTKPTDQGFEKWAHSQGYSVS